MSLYKAKQCILQVSGIHWAGGEIQVRRGGIYQWRKVEQGGGWIDKENAVLRELYRSLVTKRKLSNIAKLSVFKSAFVRILTYDPESWVMTEMKSQEQAAEMGFLRRSHDVTLRDKVHSCEIRRALKVEPFSFELREHRYIGSALCPLCPTKDWRGKSSWTDLSEIPVDHEAFQALQELQPPRPSKSGHENEWIE